MADHLSDQEQLEALKKWWRTNGTAILLAVVLVAGGWFGWNYWQDSRQKQAEQASVVYMAMLDALNKWESDGAKESAEVVAAHGETLKSLDSDQLYGFFGAMAIARLAVADGDLENAAAELDWVLANSSDETLRSVVTLRLAAVEHARDNSDRALSLLQEPYPDSFRALYEELRGDILAGSGETESAIAAYKVALENLDETESRAQAVLELKLNELGSAASGQAAGNKEES